MLDRSQDSRSAWLQSPAACVRAYRSAQPEVFPRHTPTSCVHVHARARHEIITRSPREEPAQSGAGGLLLLLSQTLCKHSGQQTTGTVQSYLSYLPSHEGAGGSPGLRTIVVGSICV